MLFLGYIQPRTFDFLSNFMSFHGGPKPHFYLNFEQSCIEWLTFILHRMEVMHMNNKFDFKDVIQFGMFIIALLTFIYLICH